MFKKIKIIQSQETSVKKLVFTKDNAVAEAVLYKYPDYKERTVICCSSMSGCPVGCRFCGAGDYFVRSLSGEEIVEQVNACITETKTKPENMKRLQIMFMSMGEPLLNKNGMLYALKNLNKKYPGAALLISTIGPRIDYEWLFNISAKIPEIGLQFSIHKTTNEERNNLIPFSKKLDLKEISEIGKKWNEITGRKPFFNYCAGDDNSTKQDAETLSLLFNPSIWEATVSVICERNDGLPAKNNYQQKLARDFSAKLLNLNFNVRVFDPAGQDDIGGGCGQLFHTQKWFRENPEKAKPSIGYGRKQIHTPIIGG